MTNKLRYYDALTESAAVYIPTTYSVNGTLGDAEIDKAIDDATALMSMLFGGATVTKGFGAWTSDTAGVVKEIVYIVTAAASHIGDDEIDALVDFAEDIRERFEQEAVTLEINGAMHFIDGTHTAYAEFDNAAY